MCVSPVGFEGNLSLMNIVFFFSGGLKQMEENKDPKKGTLQNQAHPNGCFEGTSALGA